MAVVEVRVPDIGDFKDVAVSELLVKPGDRVAVDQSLITVESDKASMEIPSSHAGIVQSLQVKMGDKVNQGSLLVMMEVVDVSAAAAAAAAAAPAVMATAVPAALPQLTDVIAAPTGAAGGTIEVKVPDIGDFKDVAVIELMVKVGDTVKQDQSLITVESDKASMEIPSSHAGVVRELKLKLGDKLNQGSPVLVLEVAGSAATAPAAAAAPASVAAAEALAAAHAAAPASATASASATATASAFASPAAAAPAPAAQQLPAHEPGAAPVGMPHASPSVRKIARELGVPLAEVNGSGQKGRITQADVEGFIKRVMSGDAQTLAQKARQPAAAAASAGPAATAGGSFPGLLPWPQVDFAKFGPIERKDLSRIKKISGANLHRNWVVIPHVTNHDDADITALESFRVKLNEENAKSGVKVTMLAFLIKASVAALKKFPEFNASLDGEQLVLKNYFHIGFAADTPNGLMVPVIKDADKKGILQISQEMNELAKKARDGKLGPADMQGGCFSISSLGGIGGRYFTPIINAPEVAILGVCRSSQQPHWDEAKQQFVPRLTLPLSLSWDHRVIDGATAARFNAYLALVLADFRRVML